MPRVLDSDGVGQRLCSWFSFEFVEGVERNGVLVNRKLATGGVLLVALGAATWGTDTVLRASLNAAFAPVLLVLGEHLILMAYAIPAVARGWREFRGFNPGQWGALLFVGWGGSAIATVLFTLGLFRAFQAGEGAINTVLLLQKTQPLFAIVAAAIILRERLTIRYLPILAVAAIGAYLLTFGSRGWELLTPFNQLGQARLGFALVALGAAFIWGTSTVMGRYLSERLSFPTLTGARFLTALPLLVVMALVMVPDPFGNLASGLGQQSVAINLFLLALFPGLLGLLLYYRGLRSTRASYATLAELAYPATGVLLNWLVLGEPLSPLQGLGVVLVVVAIFAMNQVKSAVRVAPPGTPRFSWLPNRR